MNLDFHTHSVIMVNTFQHAKMKKINPPYIFFKGSYLRIFSSATNLKTNRRKDEILKKCRINSKVHWKEIQEISYTACLEMKYHKESAEKNGVESKK